MKPTIVCLGAEAKTLHCVCCKYSIDGVQVLVYWNNEKYRQGVLDFTLSDYVECADPDMLERVVNAIRAGEADDNIDLDLYIALRDKYDSVRCEFLAHEVFSKESDRWAAETRKKK